VQRVVVIAAKNKHAMQLQLPAAAARQLAPVFLDMHHQARPPPSSTASHFWQVCGLCLTRDLSQECMTVTLLKGFSLNDSSMMTPRLGYPIAFFPLLPLVSTQHNLAMNGTRNLTTVGRARMCSASSDEYDHMYHLRLLQNKPPHQTLLSIPLFTLVCALSFCTKQAAT